MSDFEVEISGEGGSYRVAARSSAGETGPVPVIFPFDDLELSWHMQAAELALVKSSATVRRLAPVEERPVQEFGQQLFEFVFPPELRAHLMAGRQQAAGEGTPLRVRLRVGPAELAALPWEFLYDPGRDDYLCLSTPLMRYLDVLEPRRPLTVASPLRFLAMIARPNELDPLDVEHERRRLTEALGPLQSEGRVQLSWVEGQTWWHLQDALDQGPWHGFHFVGHGGFDAHSGEGVLAFAAEDGGVDRVGARDLALLLAEHHSLRLVVLNSCDTARASAADRFSSTASVLMRRGIPAVVAMQYEISDPAAIAFARGFYTALARQHPVDQAVTRARRAIKLARRNTLEWATPVLYLRSATGALFDLTDAPARRPQATPADVFELEVGDAEQTQHTRSSPTRQEPTEEFETLVNQGRLLEEQGDMVGARAAYQQAIDSGHPEQAPRALNNLGVLLKAQGDMAGAGAAYQQAIDSGHREWGPRALVNLGVLLKAQGDMAGARVAYLQAIDSGHPEQAPRALNNLGVLLKAQGDMAGARVAYLQAIDSGHRESAPTAAFNLGVLLEEQGDKAGARAAYLQAIDSGHREWAPRALNNLGVLLKAQGDMAGARVAYLQAIDSGHREWAPRALNNLGVVLYEQGDMAGARAAYLQAIDSGHREWAPRALVNLGVLLKAQGDMAGARAAYLQAIDSGHPEQAPRALNNLGVLLKAQGDMAGARVAYQQAIDSGHRESAPTAAFNLGVLLEEQGDKAGAQAAYQQAIDSGHREWAPRALVNLGRLLEKEDDKAGAGAAGAAYMQAINSGHPMQALKALKAMTRLRW